MTALLPIALVVLRVVIHLRDGSRLRGNKLAARAAMFRASALEAMVSAIAQRPAELALVIGPEVPVLTVRHSEVAQTVSEAGISLAVEVETATPSVEVLGDTADRARLAAVVAALQVWDHAAEEASAAAGAEVAGGEDKPSGEMGKEWLECNDEISVGQ